MDMRRPLALGKQGLSSRIASHMLFAPGKHVAMVKAVHGNTVYV